MLSSSHTENSSKENIIFFPFAGGTGEFYIPWFKHFDSSVSCHYAMLSGRGRLFNKSAIDNIDEQVDVLIPEILKIADRPFSFFGHSMGALIAFELTKKLFYKHNLLPKHLFISGHRAPSLDYKRRLLHKMDKEQLIEEIKKMGSISTSGDIDLELLEPFLPTLYSDFKLCETYNYSKGFPLPCPISILWGNNDLIIQKENINLWQLESDRDINYYSFDGDHFYLENNVNQIVNIVNKHLRSE